MYRFKIGDIVRLKKGQRLVPSSMYDRELEVTGHISGGLHVRLNGYCEAFYYRRFELVTPLPKSTSPYKSFCAAEGNYKPVLDRLVLEEVPKLENQKNCEMCRSYISEQDCTYCNDKDLFGFSEEIMLARIKELEKENEGLKNATKAYLDWAIHGPIIYKPQDEVFYI